MNDKANIITAEMQEAELASQSMPQIPEENPAAYVSDVPDSEIHNDGDITRFRLKWDDFSVRYEKPVKPSVSWDKRAMLYAENARGTLRGLLRLGMLCWYQPVGLFWRLYARPPNRRFRINYKLRMANTERYLLLSLNEGALPLPRYFMCMAIDHCRKEKLCYGK